MHTMGRLIMMIIWKTLIGSIAASVAASLIVILICRIRFGLKRRRRRVAQDVGDNEQRSVNAKKIFSVAFFHPHCTAGGGGERVLWSCIEALSSLRRLSKKKGEDDEVRNRTGSSAKTESRVGSIDEDRKLLEDDRLNTKAIEYEIHVTVYTTDEWTEHYHQDAMQHVKARFGIHLPNSLPLSFVHMVVEKKASQKQSLIVQSLSSMILSWKALDLYTPDVFFDTTGFAFTFVIARILAGCKIAAYVHYPTISTDMLSLVWERRPTYNNTEAIASSRITTYYKMLYYLGYAVAYGTVGSLATLVMVNSSWTYGHIRSLWRGVRKVHIVFPPCDTESFETLPLNSRERERIVLSIAQFRPEKDHVLQLRSFALYLSKYQPQENVTLVLIGSCRGKDDEGRVQDLRNLAKTLGVDNKVEFVLNQPFPELRPWLGRASVGLHTMWNEHFGIGVVEMMSAGLITIAHNSGGPKADIIVPHKTGFLAGSAEEYALAIDQAMQISSTDEGLTMRRAARDSAKRFSDKVFVDSFHHAFLSANLF